MKIQDIYQNEQKNIKYGYVAVRPDSKTANKLNSLLKSIGVSDTINHDELHATLMYSIDMSIDENTMKIINQPSLEYDDIVFNDIYVLGNAIVIKFDSSKLNDRFKFLSKYLKHTYRDILLHMSLKYYEDIENEEAKNDISLINNFLDDIKSVFSEVIFSGEYFEELDN
jgi:hypothetical protein